MDYKILIVDDESDVLEFVGYNLRKEGFTVFTAGTGKEAVDIAKQYKPHLIILDVMMPEMDGIETCKLLRQIPDLNNPVITFLTARGEDYSQIAGLDAGADDYITKPVKPAILVGKVKALLRRFSEKGTIAEEVKTSDLVINREKYIVTKDGKEYVLPKKEFELLALLASKPDKVFAREEIYSKIWGDDVIVGDRTIDVHIRKIRERLGITNIKTIKGVGYKYESL